MGAQEIRDILRMTSCGTAYRLYVGALSIVSCLESLWTPLSCKDTRKLKSTHADIFTLIWENISDFLSYKEFFPDGQTRFGPIFDEQIEFR